MTRALCLRCAFRHLIFGLDPTQLLRATPAYWWPQRWVRAVLRRSYAIYCVRHREAARLARLARAIERITKAMP